MNNVETVRDAPRTRARILTVARASFVRHGYDGTTVRSVAAAAGVAPNLITRYFGSKTGLFQAATTLDLGVRETLPGPYSELGRRMAQRIVSRWRDRGDHDPLLMMMRSAGSSSDGAAALEAFLTEQASKPLMAHVAKELGCTKREAADRVAAVSAFIMGVCTARHIMAGGPLAAASLDDLEVWFASMLQRLLDGPQPPNLGGLGSWGKSVAPVAAAGSVAAAI